MKKIALAVLLAASVAPAAFANEHTQPKWVDGYFGRVDTNKDGSVSKDEYMANATRKFEKMDANKDGNLSKEEMSVRRTHRDMKKDGAAPAAEEKKPAN